MYVCHKCTQFVFMDKEHECHATAGWKAIEADRDRLLAILQKIVTASRRGWPPPELICEAKDAVGGRR